MSKRSSKRKAGGRASTARASNEQLTLQQAAEQIGMDPAELAGFIREAGLEPDGPETEWRLEAADVVRLRSERAKLALRNASELEKAARELE